MTDRTDRQTSELLEPSNRRQKAKSEISENSDYHMWFWKSQVKTRETFYFIVNIP